MGALWKEKEPEILKVYAISLLSKPHAQQGHHEGLKYWI
jgi:hypothetical protein